MGSRQEGLVRGGGGDSGIGAGGDDDAVEDQHPHAFVNDAQLMVEDHLTAASLRQLLEGL